MGGTVPHGISSLGVTGAIVTRTNHLLRSQGAATNTEIRPRRQLGHGVVNAARRISLKHPKTTGCSTENMPWFPLRAKPETSRFGMTNLEDTNRA